MIDISDITELTWLTIEQLIEIESYLNKIIDVWINKNPIQEFGVPELLGGSNRDWNGTPMQYLYDHFYSIYKDDEMAKEKAAYNSGILVNKVVLQDRVSDVKQISWKPHRYIKK